jgi:hypothetical protein
VIFADVTYVVPSGGGTITSFSFASIADSAGQQLDFLVLRPAGGSNYTVVGKTGLVTLAGTGAVESFPANIAVQAGDILGFFLSSPNFRDCVRAVVGGGGEIAGGATSDPSVGALVSLPGGPFTLQDLNLSAFLDTTPTSIADLIVSVEDLNLHHGIENSLVKKLTNAQKNLAEGHTAGACGKLASFISEVKAQRGKKVATGDADDLIDQAAAVRQSLGCNGT